MIESRYDKVFFKDVISTMQQGINTAADKVQYVDSGVPIIQSKHFTSGSLELKGTKFLGIADTEKYGSKYVPEKGDILFSNIGTVGKSVVVDEDSVFMFAWNVFLMKPKSEVIVSRYLQKYLDFLLKRNIYERWFTGGTVKFINKKTIAGFEIPLPPLAEQQKIAAILDAADTLGQKDQQLIDHYTTLSQSLFLDMFGDPVTNPMRWDKHILKIIGSVSTGNTPPRANPVFYGNHIEWIKTNNINTPNMQLTPAEEYLSEEGLNVGRSVDPNSLLITCIAGSKKVIGNVAIADRKVAFNQQINSFSPFSGNILYFYYLFILGKKHIQSFSTGAIKGMISKSKFESIDFICPPINLQNQFAEIIQQIEAQKQQAQASLKHSEALFNSLLQRAFNGELSSPKSSKT